ncbi:MAG: hypothetical protein JWO06_3384 [Bacteroidota bacterium]|nr:hypothetical protein [Bacteroidota bacterium]
MTKIFCLSILVWSWSTVLGQNYTPFPEGNATWEDFYRNVDEDQLDWTIYRMEGDTIINGLVYHIVSAEVFQYSNLNGGGGSNFHPEFCYLRQDSFLKRIYYLDKDRPGEILLYDFNLTIGDTSKAPQFFEWSAYYSSPRVFSIDTFFSDKGYKRYNFEIYDSFQNKWDTINSWIEGIGSTAGFFENFYPPTVEVAYAELECFSSHNYKIFPSNGPGNCLSPYYSVNALPATLAFHIFPNPTNDFCALSFDVFEGACDAHFIDLSGREIMNISITKTLTQIPISNLPSGLYFIKLTDELGHIGVAKLVKE